MNPIKAIIRKLASLFVDDARFAGAIGLWLLVIWQVLPRIMATDSAWSGLALFLGLAAILLDATLRRSGSR